MKEKRCALKRILRLVQAISLLIREDNK